MEQMNDVLRRDINMMTGDRQSGVLQDMSMNKHIKFAASWTAWRFMILECQILH
jgi:hypothetical protein